MIFTGSMDWLPNEDAMLFFCRDVLPLIRAAEPGVRLTIVGRTPTPAVRKLADDAGIRVTGRVDDVRPYMKDAAVYVVPLRIGGGTRLKIFEAMAMGKAVVSTTVGAEGTAGDQRRARRDRRRAEHVRPRGRPSDARRRAPAPARSGGAGARRWRATTGRRSPASWNPLWNASPFDPSSLRVVPSRRGTTG